VNSLLRRNEVYCNAAKLGRGGFSEPLVGKLSTQLPHNIFLSTTNALLRNLPGRPPRITSLIISDPQSLPRKPPACRIRLPFHLSRRFRAIRATTYEAKQQVEFRPPADGIALSPPIRRKPLDGRGPANSCVGAKPNRTLPTLNALIVKAVPVYIDIIALNSSKAVNVHFRGSSCLKLKINIRNTKNSHVKTLLRAHKKYKRIRA
jgi:hypothetical protein